MKTQRIIAVVIAIAGALSIGGSAYINKEVKAGKQQIASGQQKVDAGKKLFQIVPETAPIGEAFTGSAQERIDRGRRDVAHYEGMSKKLRIGGIVLIALGALLFILKRK